MGIAFDLGGGTLVVISGRPGGSTRSATTVETGSGGRQGSVGY